MPDTIPPNKAAELAQDFALRATPGGPAVDDIRPETAMVISIAYSLIAIEKHLRDLSESFGNAIEGDGSLNVWNKGDSNRL